MRRCPPRASWDMHGRGKNVSDILSRLLGTMYLVDPCGLGPFYKFIKIHVCFIYFNKNLDGSISQKK